jgi:hypothetical protein
MKPRTQRRQQRYGRLVRGWGWRTTPERLQQMQRFIDKHGMDKTEFLERAVDEYLDNHRADAVK